MNTIIGENCKLQLNVSYQDLDALSTSDRKTITLHLAYLRKVSMLEIKFFQLIFHYKPNINNHKKNDN